MKRRSLIFTGPGEVSVQEEDLSGPAPGEVLVRSLVSAISPGTEMLIYRGEAPQELATDETISALSGSLAFPLKYGYALVGRVEGLGQGVDPGWADRLVFAFHPHESAFTAPADDLIPLPDGITPEQAAFLPNFETAVTFVLDGAPLLGEQVVVFGQGVVGLLTTALLARFPLAALATLDRYPLRREISVSLGAQVAFDPADSDVLDALRDHLQAGRPYAGADLTYELSGAPAALDQAVAVTGYHGRVVIGSWYGQKRVSLNLGGAFHRSRMRLISSQVSTLSPDLRGRWRRERRFDAAWSAIRETEPERLITHRFSFDLAPEAYRLLDKDPSETIQTLLVYK